MSATASPSSPADPRRPSPAPTEAARVPLEPGVILDARRALFLAESRSLVIADPHLGYAWVQRRRGVLLPVAASTAHLSRLSGLLESYQPRRLVILGDLVHQAVALPALVSELAALADLLPSGLEWIVCAGNHDAGLEALLGSGRLGRRPQVVPAWSSGRYQLLHGDHPPEPAAERALLAEDPVHIIGHEHPALRLGDGVATEAKVPCFLVAQNVWVLPAFSDWAAGCEVGRQPFLGECARRATFRTAYACLGSRMLRIPLRNGAGPASPRVRQSPSGRSSTA